MFATAFPNPPEPLPFRIEVPEVAGAAETSLYVREVAVTSLLARVTAPARVLKVVTPAAVELKSTSVASHPQVPVVEEVGWATAGQLVASSAAREIVPVLDPAV